MPGFFPVSSHQGHQPFDAYTYHSFFTEQMDRLQELTPDPTGQGIVNAVRNIFLPTAIGATLITMTSTGCGEPMVGISAQSRQDFSEQLDPEQDLQVNFKLGRGEVLPI